MANEIKIQVKTTDTKPTETSYFLDLAERMRSVCGDCTKIYDALGEHPWLSVWLPLKVTDSVLRGIAQVCFANNTISGLLILIGLFVGDVRAGGGAVLCSIIAIATAKFTHQDDGAIRAGLTNFSPVLVGTVTASLYPLFFTKPFNGDIWFYMMMTTVFSVCVSIGLGVLLSKHNLPGYTLPFNISTSIIFICLRAKGYAEPLQGADTAANDEINVTQGVNVTSLDDLHVESSNIQWDQVWLGTLLTVGQVYAVESIACSILILIGLVLCSPMIAAASYLGGLLATFTALAVSSAPYTLVYAGVWGYNGFLSAACITFFMVPHPKMIAMAAINAIFTSCLQAAIVPVFSANNLPVFTYPFCLSSLLFLALTTSAGMGSQRVANPTYPEHHLALSLEKSEEVND
ncbi:LOW QUALITY PROTEIN: urea transporter 1-like [Palaemon carinicauda]|uniref:LOW QUALITY PROTEIN: urea transporter 1-like n=1 Tax=Palaemon carinicauda TaxID=392227 RepID=UPI0035B60454